MRSVVATRSSVLWLHYNLASTPYEPRYLKTIFFAYAKTKTKISCAMNIKQVPQASLQSICILEGIRPQLISPEYEKDENTKIVPLFIRVQDCQFL